MTPVDPRRLLVYNHSQLSIIALAQPAKEMLVVKSKQGGGEMKNRDAVGVVIGRFQTSKLHAGHRSVISHAVKNHKDVLIVLGCPRTRPTNRDPLDYETRKKMVLASYPEARVSELKDRYSNQAWSQALDDLVAHEFPGRNAVLYGSRNSFISSYMGKYPCVELKSVNASVSGTKIRNGVAANPLASKHFRMGMIYGIKHRPPISYQTVDIAVIDYDRKLLLLAKKIGGDGFHFIGGFVDVEDSSLEMAARRETSEETSSLGVGEFKDLGSFRIDDWRYRGTEDKILTSFFAARYIFGAPRANDDVDGLEWVSWDKFFDLLVEEHKVLGKRLMAYLTGLEPEKGGK